MTTTSQFNQYLGLRNAVQSLSLPQHWRYLLFYECDTENDNTAYQLKAMYDRLETSYVLYRTLHGYHAVGLTPLTALRWGSYYQTLDNIFHEFYGGQTIRISRKRGEKRELFAYSFRFPYVEKLADHYSNLFDIPKDELPTFGSPPQYSLVMEKYRSEG